MAARSDEELVAEYQARRGASGAAVVNELFSRYSRKVALWCYRFTGDQDQAADLAQEVFTRAYRHLDSFRGDAKFSTWLYSIVRNHCLNAAKTRAMAPEQIADSELAETADPNAASAFEAIEQAEMAALARELMAECLDETERRVMVLHYGEDVPLADVTRVLGLSNSSGAKAYIVSAKRKLSLALRRRTSGSAPARRAQ